MGSNRGSVEYKLMMKMELHARGHSAMVGNPLGFFLAKAG